MSDSSEDEPLQQKKTNQQEATDSESESEASSVPPAMRDTTVNFRNSGQSTFVRGLALLFTVSGLGSIEVSGREPDQLVDLWPQLAPGETTRESGEPLPPRAGEK